MDVLQFELRKLGREYSIPVRLMDMRSGIKDENTKEHLTWIECRKGIEECKSQSMGVVFLSLQGNKYGYTPLPKIVLQTDLEQHITTKELSKDTKELIFQWYVLDRNANPPEYVLKNLSSKDDETYWEAYNKLFPVLTGLPFDTKHYQGLRVGMSVTEYELRGVLATHPVELEDKEGQLCWSFRNLSGDIQDENYCDTATADSGQESQIMEKQQKVEAYKNLIGYMRQEIPKSSVQSYDSDLTLNDLQTKTAKHTEYLEAFKAFVRGKLTKSLNDIIQKRQEWTKNSNGLELEGDEASEMLRHCKFAFLKCCTFVGRKDLIEETIRSIEAPNRTLKDGVTEFDPLHHFLGIAVSIIGVSGAGKTALMCKVASEIYKRKGGERRVIIRFCGTSPKSKDARNLTASICRQIEVLHRLQPVWPGPLP
jgi:hypothetical protein